MNVSEHRRDWLAQEDIDHVFVASDPVTSRASIDAILVSTSLTPGRRLEWECIRARTFSLEMKVGEALAVLKSIEERLDETSSVGRSRWLLERGRAYLASGDRKGACQYFQRAYENANAVFHDYLAVDALHMLGIAQDGAEALRWNEVAIARIWSSTDAAVQRWLGPLLNNTAWTYFDMGEYDKARVLFEQDVAYRTEQGRVAEARIARYSLARTYRAIGSVSTALEMQRELAREIEKSGASLDGTIEEEIGECLSELGRTDEARPHFLKAYEMLSHDAWFKKHQPERLERLRIAGSAD